MNRAVTLYKNFFKGRPQVPGDSWNRITTPAHTSVPLRRDFLRHLKLLIIKKNINYVVYIKLKTSVTQGSIKRVKGKPWNGKRYGQYIKNLCLQHREFPQVIRKKLQSNRLKQALPKRGHPKG